MKGRLCLKKNEYSIRETEITAGKWIDVYLSS